MLIMLMLALPPASAQNEEEEEEIAEFLNPEWTGDLKGMYKRDKVRALVVFNKMQYFLDGSHQRGAAYDLLKEFEKQLNKKRKGAIKMQVVFVPVVRDDIIPALLDGRGDVAVANLTITSEREKLVDFSGPLLENVSEMVITGPSAPEVESVDDLAGKEIYARPSSSYYQHLQDLNEQFKQQGKPAMVIRKADENLEDSDLLEMVNAGMIPMVVVDGHKALFWKDIFENIKVHENISVHTGGEIGWAFRKKSPKLKKEVNRFVKKHKKGTLMGNMLHKRYLQENKWAKSALSEKEQKKFRSLMDLFQKYSGEYDFDWLMIAALSYQESQHDQSKRSGAGAIGVMQVLPSTAKDSNVGITKINKLENNVHAGVKYLRFLRDRYFNDPEIDPLNQALFSFAAYNAGPAKVAKLRKEAAQQGFDPNVWFGNVEVIAARRIGRETVQYVSNIYKYYLAYQLIVERMQSKGEAKRAALKGKPDAGDAATVIDSEDDDAVPIEEDKTVADAGDKLIAAQDSPEPEEAGGGPTWLWFVGGLLLGGVLIALWRLFGSRFQRHGAVRVDTDI
ncbi:MAG: lytic transglycosylase F [Pseudomonadota bacterium]|nr:lytic transglycosylase F [Pseudomonadota bacterium]